MKISNETAWGSDGSMAIAAVRYCLGRMTYIVQDCAQWLEHQWPNIPEPARKIIQRDVEQAFADEARSDSAMFRPLGMTCDKREWERVRKLWRQGVTE